jgi:hypothetical protein
MAQLDSEQRRRLRSIGSPWIFKDVVLESQYQTELRDSLYNRARPTAQITVLFSWLCKIPQYIVLYFSETAREDVNMALIRVLLLGFFTPIFTLNFDSETRRRAGMAFIWVSRAILLPLYLYLETGIPFFSTELLSAQVSFHLLRATDLSCEH